MPEEIDKKIEINQEISISPEREIAPKARLEEKPEILSEEKEIIVKPEIKKEIPEEIKEIKTLDQRNQVKVLCDLAFQKGIDQAIKTARDLNNAYILDEFHDTLIDKLREQLIEKGRLAEK